MHLTSSLNQNSEGDNVPIAIFCFGEQRKFVLVTEDYQDTSRRVCRAFKIAEDAKISLQTSTFEVCKEKDTVIDESAYPLMWNALEEVRVIIDESTEGQTQKPRLRNVSEPLPTPAETPSNTQSDNDVYHHSLLETSARSGSVITPKKGEEDKNYEFAEEFLPGEEHEDIYESREIKQTKKVPQDREPSTSKIHIKFKPAITSNAASPLTHVDIIPRVKKEKMAQPILSRTQEIPKQDGLRTRSEVPDLPASDDPRFEIVITGPDNSSAHFKTRGKHPVRKVLAAACKTFGIKYESAHLVLVLSFDEDEGLQTHHFVCPPEDTMSKCGVNSDSKLFIKVDEDDENDNSD
ncbi:hypothetical protein CPB84DRAFT_1777017 [Gymnopilus junonius]|uniref:Uncharacterized protein n=1 Tax=Gymnopilus junonius TaxID=109634 RepID=A0A9P5TP08_GYMJU|nr:hypothetical protein CPB84DRAFT_1777017 [Gymnopilus junonius]